MITITIRSGVQTLKNMVLEISPTKCEPRRSRTKGNYVHVLPLYIPAPIPINALRMPFPASRSRPCDLQITTSHYLLYACSSLCAFNGTTLLYVSSLISFFYLYHKTIDYNHTRTFSPYITWYLFKSTLSGIYNSLENRIS